LGTSRSDPDSFFPFFFAFFCLGQGGFAPQTQSCCEAAGKAKNAKKKGADCFLFYVVHCKADCLFFFFILKNKKELFSKFFNFFYLLKIKKKKFSEKRL
jgi:hypothetical protein